MAEQSVSALADVDLERPGEQRAVVPRYLDEDGLETYETAPGKLGTLRTLLHAELFSLEQTYELQSMGIVLGDVFVQEIGFHWIIVEVKPAETLRSGSEVRA